MNLLPLLNKKNISIYRLSKLSDVPYSTLNDICHERVSLQKCSAETVYKIAKVLSVSMEELIEPGIDMCAPKEKSMKTGTWVKKPTNKSIQFTTRVDGIPVDVRLVNSKYVAEFVYQDKAVSLPVIGMIENADKQTLPLQ